MDTRTSANMRTVRALSTIYMVIASLLLLVLLGGVAAGGPVNPEKAHLVPLGLLVAGVGLAIGLGMRRFASWSGWLATATSALGLFAFPIGTIVFSVILFALFRTRKVFSATPQVIAPELLVPPPSAPLLQQYQREWKIGLIMAAALVVAIPLIRFSDPRVTQGIAGTFFLAAWLCFQWSCFRLARARQLHPSLGLLGLLGPLGLLLLGLMRGRARPGARSWATAAS